MLTYFRRSSPCGGKVKKKELGGEMDDKKSKLVKSPNLSQEW